MDEDPNIHGPAERERAEGMRARIDVFVSYASEDKAVADAAVSHLERAGVRCWYAPRDIVPGASYGSAIVEAIRDAAAVVLILSKASNRSAQVANEIERGVHHGRHIVPFRIEEVALSSDLEYFVGRRHWLDALPPPAQRHIDRLVAVVQAVLRDGGPASAPHPVPARRSRLLPKLAVAGLLAAAAILLGKQFLWTGDSGEGGSPDPPGAGGTPDPGQREADPPAPPPDGSERGGDRTGEAPEEPGDPEEAPSGPGPPGAEPPSSTPPADLPAGRPPDAPARPGDLLQELEGQLGGGRAPDATHSLVAPADGRVWIEVRNLNPEAADAGAIAAFAIDGRRYGRIRPSETKTSHSFLAARAGQVFVLSLASRDAHVVPYRISMRTETLADLGLRVPDPAGMLGESAEGALGFGRPRFETWTYEAPENGIVDFAIANRMPENTGSSQIDRVVVDSRPTGAVRPGGRRQTPAAAVAKGQRIPIEIKAGENDCLVYSLRANFRSLADLGLGLPPEGELLESSAEGALGFGRAREAVWSYRAPSDGRFHVRVTNLLPRGTSSANISGFSVDTRRGGQIPPDASKDSATLAVRAGQTVPIRVAAPADHNTLYRIDAFLRPP